MNSSLNQIETNTTLNNREKDSNVNPKSFPYHYTNGIFPGAVTDNELNQLPSIQWFSQDKSNFIFKNIPELMGITKTLISKTLSKDFNFNATDFIKDLSQLSLNPMSMYWIIENIEKNHILYENETIKINLIKWDQGKESSIHGHDEGGCVLKVLKGELVEERYIPNNLEQPVGYAYLKQGGMAYIDDHMGYHKVCNSGDSVAISIHVYTSGKK